MSTHQTSYDEVPYQSWPYAQSHPDRLAAVATLLGLAPQPLGKARVLELACAAGGNLIPIAELFPESEFVGIDLSRSEIDEGNASIESLGLKNIRLLHQDIAEVNQGLGSFHYIIAHGVFSWVAEEVQERIFTVCRERLEPNGIAYVSYNTFPGWRMRGMIRDMLVYHSQQFDEPQTRIDQARALLQFLADWAPAEPDPYGTLLKQELEVLNRSRDDYLYHDHLEGVNEPIYFHQFAERAQAHQLAYLGESDLASMATSNLPTEAEETLDRISQDRIQIEQYMDFLRNRTFRQSLLCHADQSIDCSLNPQYVEELYFSTPLAPHDLSVDVQDETPLRFRAESIELTTADPLIKSALSLLAQAAPLWLPFDKVLREARDRSASKVAVEVDRRHLAEHLIRCYASNAVELHAVEPRFVGVLSDRPCVSPLARLQAEQGQVATNRRHELVNFDDISREVALLLDGARDRTAILKRLQQMTDDGQLAVRSNEKPLSDKSRIAEILEESLDATLEQFRASAMLIG